MRSKFDAQLEQLNQELIMMGALCEEAINDIAESLLLGDLILAQKAIDLEENIDQKERDIENLCMKMLLQQQPVARDLRLISAAMKMITDMERIGDQAQDIAEIIGYGKIFDTPSSVSLAEMAQATAKMVTGSIDAYVKRDLSLAQEVIDYDDIVDALFDKVKGNLIPLLQKDLAHSEMVLDMLMMAKYFERIGDHAVNIAVWVGYSITGEHSRHLTTFISHVDDKG